MHYFPQRSNATYNKLLTIHNIQKSNGQLKFQSNCIDLQDTMIFVIYPNPVKINVIHVYKLHHEVNERIKQQLTAGIS